VIFANCIRPPTPEAGQPLPSDEERSLILELGIHFAEKGFLLALPMQHYLLQQLVSSRASFHTLSAISLLVQNLFTLGSFFRISDYSEFLAVHQSLFFDKILSLLRSYKQMLVDEQLNALLRFGSIKQLLARGDWSILPEQTSRFSVQQPCWQINTQIKQFMTILHFRERILNQNSAHLIDTLRRLRADPACLISALREVASTPSAFTMGSRDLGSGPVAQNKLKSVFDFGTEEDGS